MEENLDERGERSALFVVLSKAFDCLQHDLLLSAYGFDCKSLKFIWSFLSQKQTQNKS